MENEFLPRLDHVYAFDVSILEPDPDVITGGREGVYVIVQGNPDPQVPDTGLNRRSARRKASPVGGIINPFPVVDRCGNEYIGFPLRRDR